MDQVSIICDVSITELWKLDLDQNGQVTVADTKSVVWRRDRRSSAVKRLQRESAQAIKPVDRRNTAQGPAAIPFERVARRLRPTDGRRGSRIYGDKHHPPWRVAMNEKHAIQVQAESYLDQNGVEKLRRVRLDSRQIEIAENIDQWHGPDYRYFKVRGSDGSLYIFRQNETQGDWALTMYERARYRRRTL